jgi:hypothetical protein
MTATNQPLARRFWITLSVLCLPVGILAAISPATIVLWAPWHIVAVWGFLVAAGWSVATCALAPLVAPRDSRIEMFLYAAGIQCLCLVFILFWAFAAQMTSM